MHLLTRRLLESKCTSVWPFSEELHVGCGGRKLSEVEHTQPVWLEHAEMEYGFGKVSVRGRRLRFEYIHSETGHIADSVDLKIGRSAVRSCNSLEAEGGARSMENEMSTQRDGILSERSISQQEQLNFLNEKVVGPSVALESVSGSNNVQTQEITVQ